MPITFNGFNAKQLYHGNKPIGCESIRFKNIASNKKSLSRFSVRVIKKKPITIEFRKCNTLNKIVVK